MNKYLEIIAITKNIKSSHTMLIDLLLKKVTYQENNQNQISLLQALVGVTHPIIIVLFLICLNANLMGDSP